MSTLDEVGERDGWRCWLCDEPVDPNGSVNADRGPSIDGGASIPGRGGAAGGGKAGKAKKAVVHERLAHRACNTRKGAVAAVVPWSPDLFVVDPAPIVASVERIGRKGGREVVARSPSRDDAEQASGWLLDRLSRLAPDLELTTSVDAGGGQFLVVLQRG